MIYAILGAILLVILVSLRQVNQYQRGVMFTMGRFTGIKNPGWRIVLAVSQLAQTTMRNAVGEVELDELLSQRDNVSERIRSVVDKATDPWGIKVDNVELKDIALPENMERTIAKQAEAERERRAVIIKAEGEVAAAENLSKAAAILAGSPG